MKNVVDKCAKSSCKPISTEKENDEIILPFIKWYETSESCGHRFGRRTSGNNRYIPVISMQNHEQLLIFPLTPDRHSRILHYFWCVWGWSMLNKYQGCCLWIAWIKKSVKNIMKRQKYTESPRMTFASWKLINLLILRWSFYTVQQLWPLRMRYVHWDF